MPRHQDQGRWYPELRQAQRASGTAGAQSGAADTRGRSGEIRQGRRAKASRTQVGRECVTGQGCGGGALLQRGREDSDSSGPGERAAE